ncbi:hypothetical protein D3C73_955710 [compost metagenome]
MIGAHLIHLFQQQQLFFEKAVLFHKITPERSQQPGPLHPLRLVFRQALATDIITGQLRHIQRKILERRTDILKVFAETDQEHFRLLPVPAVLLDEAYGGSGQACNRFDQSHPMLCFLPLSESDGYNPFELILRHQRTLQQISPPGSLVNNRRRQKSLLGIAGRQIPDIIRFILRSPASGYICIG